MTSAAAIVDELARLHSAAVASLRAALAAYLADGTVPAPGARATGLFAYPELNGALQALMTPARSAA